jgi:hypothetical protein
MEIEIMNYICVVKIGDDGVQELITMYRDEVIDFFGVIKDIKGNGYQIDSIHYENENSIAIYVTE